MSFRKKQIYKDFKFINTTHLYSIVGFRYRIKEYAKIKRPNENALEILRFFIGYLSNEDNNGKAIDGAKDIKSNTYFGYSHLENEIKIPKNRQTEAFKWLEKKKILVRFKNLKGANLTAFHEDFIKYIENEVEKIETAANDHIKNPVTNEVPLNGNHATNEVPLNGKEGTVERNEGYRSTEKGVPLNGTNNSSRCNIGVNKKFISSRSPTTQKYIRSLNEKILIRKVKPNGNPEFYDYDATYEVWDYFKDEEKYIRWLHWINEMVASKKLVLGSAVHISENFEIELVEPENKKPTLTLDEMAKMASEMPVPM